MADQLHPPETDKKFLRHQFYAAVAAVSSANAQAVGTIGKKLDTLALKYEAVHDIVQNSETRTKTLIKAAIFIWAVFGGAVGWYIARYAEHYDAFIDRVNVLEKKQTADEPDIAKIKDLSDKLESVKRIATESQRQLDEIQAKQGRTK